MRVVSVVGVVNIILGVCFFSTLGFSSDWIEKFESVEFNWTRLKARYVSEPISMTIAQVEAKKPESASDAVTLNGVDYPPAEEKAYAIGKQHLADVALRFYEQDLLRRGVTAASDSSEKLKSESLKNLVYRSRTIYHQSGGVQVEFELDLRSLFSSVKAQNAAKQEQAGSTSKRLMLFGQNLVPVSYFDLKDEFGMVLFSSSQMNVLGPALSARWVRGAKTDAARDSRVAALEGNLSLEIIRQNKGSLVVSRSSWIQADPEMLKSFLAQGRVQVNEF